MRNKNIKAIFLFEVALMTTGMMCSAGRSVQQVDEPTEYGVFEQLDMKVKLKITKKLSISDRSHLAQTSSKFHTLLQSAIDKSVLVRSS